MEEMEPATNPKQPLIQEDILHHLAPFLDGNTIKSARLVCSLWKYAVEKHIPNRLKLIAFQHGEGQPDPEAINSGNICPQVLTNLDFCHSSKELLWLITQERIRKGSKFSWSFPEKVRRPYHAERDFLLFFRNVTINTAVKKVKVFAGRQVHSVVKALNEGLLPNLQALEVCDLNEQIYENSYPEPLQESEKSTLFVTLPNLTWLSFGNLWFYSSEPFYQKLINAASNLLFLDCPPGFDTSNLTKLQEFKLNGMAYRQGWQEIAHQRLASLTNQLRFLKLINIELKTQFLQFPNVQKFEMKKVRINPTVPGSLATYFPNLETLSIDYLYKKETFLKRGLPETLRFIEFRDRCLHEESDSDKEESDSEDDEAEQNPGDPPPTKFLQDLQILAPKLKVAVCKFSYFGRYDMELRELLKLTFPNLVIVMEREMTFVVALKSIRNINIGTSSGNRGEILEIRNGTVSKTMYRVKVGGAFLNVVEDKDEHEIEEMEVEPTDPIELFAIATNKLLKKYKLVRFFHFKIDAEMISSLQQIIAQKGLGVELFL